MSQFADVLLPLALPRRLTYKVPASLRASLRVGMRVVVSLGPTKMYSALVARLHDEAPAGVGRLKEIVEAIDSEPLVAPEQIDFWQWVSGYYMCSEGEVMKAALPSGLRLESETRFVRAAKFDGQLNDEEAHILSLLPDKKRFCLKDLGKYTKNLANAHAVLRNLVSKGAVSVKEELQSAAALPSSPATAAAGSATAAPNALSDEQARALGEIEKAFEKKNVCLLHGVTSSGKTEIYAHLIQKTLDAGQQVLYLLPEIALTTQIVDRMARLFGGRMGVYHSKFSDRDRTRLWTQLARSDEPQLIVGVRSALFLPFRRLGLIIVDEEHEPSYKQQSPAPRYHARDAAIVLAGRAGARVLLGSATPAVESYLNAQRGKYALVELTTRFAGLDLPDIEVVDIQEAWRKKQMKKSFSPRLIDEIKAALEAKEQVILFQNRRGYSPLLECRTCGWTPHCERCDVPLTFHKSEGRLVCHYCGASYPLPEACPCCGGGDIRDAGTGTEKIEEQVQVYFPEAKTLRMDLDSAKTRRQYERIIDDVASGRVDVLIGTQMVSKGLDFDRVHAVGIIDADRQLNQPDFRAYERAFQMMSQVAGRAGRKGRRGKVILQTRKADEPIIDQIVRNDYAAMCSDQLEERRLFDFPPFCRLIKVELRHKDEHVVGSAAEEMARLLRPTFGDRILGPDRPVVARVKRLCARNLLLKIAPELKAQDVRRVLFWARDTLAADPRWRSCEVIFDVDPMQ